MARPKGVIQKRDESKYWLPEGISLKSDQINFNKETKLIFIDNQYGEFVSSFKAIQGSGFSLHPKAKSLRKSLNNPGATVTARQKAKATMLSKYGVEHALCSPEFLKKSQDTFTKNNKIEDVLNKMESTNLHRYGVKNAMQNSDIQDKQQNTLFERYGVNNPNDLPWVPEKRMQNLIAKNFSSKEELELKEYIQSLGLIAEKGYIGGSDPKELDIKVKELNIAFEMNGLYWHNEAAGKDRKYHLNKTIACSDKGIKLLHIFDQEWNTRKEQLKGFIRSALNKNSNFLYARNCELRNVEYAEAKVFLDKYHILGSTRFKGAIGLYSDNELISIVTYNNHHRNNKEFLLNRYCTKHNYTVVGGLSKLSKHLFNLIGEFSTFIDLRFSNGKSWLTSGYSLQNTLKPDYFYYNSKTHKILSKQSRKKSSVNTPNEMTELQHATLDGLVRVWDCGKLKLKYTNHK